MPVFTAGFYHLYSKDMKEECIVLNFIIIAIQLENKNLILIFSVTNNDMKHVLKLA